MLFGTDGIRGIVDKDIDINLAIKVGNGISCYLNNKKFNNKVIIGHDTRLSSSSLVAAIASSLCNNGVNVDIIGIVPTPIISYMIIHNKYDAGIMITASHNDYNYNGIKVFDSSGFKIDKIIEKYIETNLNNESFITINKGNIKYSNELINNYLDFIINEFKIDLSHMKIVLDCANGSNYSIAPFLFKKLNADVIEISCNNDGQNINNNCGANHINNLVNKVKEVNADFGFAFDGDGDRLRIVISNGQVLDGDDLLMILSDYFKNKNLLKNNSLAGTIMTNMGIEKYFNKNNIKLIRSDVGDKNVITLMKKHDIIIGGEPSGHVCIMTHIPSCDALYNSLLFLKCCSELKIDVIKYFNKNIKYFSSLKNLNVSNEVRINFDNNLLVKSFIEKLEEKYREVRIVVRPSGTESVIRIYVESVSIKLNEKISKLLTKYIKKSS